MYKKMFIDIFISKTMLNKFANFALNHSHKIGAFIGFYGGHRICVDNMNNNSRMKTKDKLIQYLFFTSIGIISCATIAPIVIVFFPYIALGTCIVYINVKLREFNKPVK